MNLNKGHRSSEMLLNLKESTRYKLAALKYANVECSSYYGSALLELDINFIYLDTIIST